MITNTYYMERPAAMPMAAPVGAVVPGLGSGHAYADRTMSAKHRAAFANVTGNAVKPWITRIDQGNQLAWLNTTRSARHLGSAST